jgi:copper chaperone CopZ
VDSWEKHPDIATGKGKNMKLLIEGMMCPHCKARVEKVLSAIEGVESVTVDLQNKCADIQGAPDLDACRQAVTNAGFKVLN